MKTSEIAPTTTLFGHPKGLFYLFFAELWERFSFYGMKALLLLYMTQHLLYSDDVSFGILSAYMSLVYITPLWGGIIADKILGYRKSILLGGILMALGHFFLSFETPLFFYGSLGLIIVGNGFFKPNISSFVGALYKNNPTQRDAGFTIFYLGINLGAAIAPLICAWVADLYGWHYGFMLAGIGMLLGLFFFQRGLNSDVFGAAGKLPNSTNYYQKKGGLNQGQWISLGAFAVVPIFAAIIYLHQYEHYLIFAATLFLVLYVLYILSRVSPLERGRLIVVIYFTLLSTLFAALFEQTGSSVVLFADRNVNLIGITAAQTNSINASFIVLLAIPFSMLWGWLNKINKNPSAPYKFSIGLILLGLAAIIFGRSAVSADAMAQTSMVYLVIGYFVLTVGELFLSPIGLSKVTELSPTRYIAFIMGVWFSSYFYGHYFAGKIAQLTVNNGDKNILTDSFGTFIEIITQLNPSIAAEKGKAFEQLYAYVSVYVSFGIITLSIGLLAFFIAPFMAKLMQLEEYKN
ncbi:peptide MFS transporter [Aureispira anguillae]|uniref:Peptide MFS transporter n=1 Tax=Aureispira anguillae TaxID=2864201 RepID=A0A915YL94_9BACT|nr:peptide MFS transporter [Aureispira anguillae]BDS14838.1 peptide MFS transporter [Aureispira anguillae]